MDLSEWTSLHHASEKGHESVVRALIESGADIHAKDNNGRTSLHLASRHGHESVVRALIESGADIHAKDNNGWTSLHTASRHCHESVVRALIESGADIHVKDKNGKTSLHFASRDAHESVVRALVELGADIHAKDKYGKTSLHLASKNGHESVVRALVELGADIHVKDNDGSTSLHLAKQRLHDHVVTVLVGADSRAQDNESSEQQSNVSRKRKRENPPVGSNKKVRKNLIIQSGKKHPSKELLSKIDSLTSLIEDFQKKNEVLSSENLQKDAEITRLQAKCTRIQKESEIMAEKFAGEQARLKAMEETHVEKKISNLPLIFESASLSELFKASVIVQKLLKEATDRLQEEKRMAEIARTRAKDERLCVVCKTEPITHQFRPCNHFCVCEHCAGKVRSSSNQCPMCRKNIQSIERTFAV